MPVQFSQYPYFEADQVLTNKQLNEAVGYLEEQNRLTRFGISGKGIICGLEHNNDGNTITINQGYGATSAGYWIEMPTQNYGFAVEYADKKNQWDQDVFPFTDSFELLPNNSGSTKKAVDLLSSNVSYVLILFVQIIKQYKEDCGNDCDEKGAEFIFNTKPILVPENQFNAQATSKLLPYIKLKRFLNFVLFQQSGNNPSNAYTAIITQNRDTVFKYLDAVLKDNNVLNALAITNSKAADLAGIIAKLNGIVPTYPYQQYYYEFLFDLETAIQEFRLHYLSMCENHCFDNKIFPFFIALGKTSLIHPDAYRHYFMKTGGNCGCDEGYDLCRRLFDRIFELITMFTKNNIGILNNHKTIQITPSIMPPAKLGNRAIPYYYPPEGSDYELFKKIWACNRNFFQPAQEIYNYYDSQKPLETNLYDNSLFRIEGHLGLGVNSVYSSISAQITANNLPINLFALGIPAKPEIAPDWNWWKKYGIIPKINVDDLKANMVEKASDFSYQLDKIMGVAVNVNAVVGSPKIFENSPNLKVKSIKTNLNNIVYNATNSSSLQVQTMASDMINNTKDVFEAVKKVNVANLNNIQKAAYDTILANNYSKWIIGYFAEIDKRQLHSMLFSKFIETYNGLEHFGGAPRGGTFILVFLSDPNNLQIDGTVIADFALPYYIDYVNFKNVNG